MSSTRSLALTASALLRTLCPRCARAVVQFPRRRLFSTLRDSIYDVVCVGGGPAGLSLLAALRSNPITSSLRLALIEAQDLSHTTTTTTTSYTPSPTQFSNRCSSLTSTSVRFLSQIGAWPHVRRDRIQPFDEMQVWDGVSGARIQFDWPPGTGPDAALTPVDGTIAYMTENANLVAGLMRRLEELGNVDVFDNCAVESIGLGEEEESEDLDLDLREWPVVRLANGKNITAHLLVGADGGNSPVRAFAGIETDGWDYNRHAVVATLELDPDEVQFNSSSTAYQRFLPTGPVALLPLPAPYATLVWSTTPERAALLKTLSHENLVAMINAAFRLSVVDIDYMHNMADDLKDSNSSSQADEYAWRQNHTPQSNPLPPPILTIQPETLASFPLRMRHADTYLGQRTVLVGDAAHTIHPLAGQGLNQGQADVASLARALATAVEHGQDVGSRFALAPYCSERYAANHVMLGVCDKLEALYSVGAGPLVTLRSVGLRAVNALEPLKTFIMQRASG